MFVFCLVFFGSFRFHPRDGPWIKATGIENVMETLRNPSGSNRQRETLPPSPFTVRRPHSASPTGCPGCHGCRGCRRCRITDADADADAGFPFFFFLFGFQPTTTGTLWRCSRGCQGCQGCLRFPFHRISVSHLPTRDSFNATEMLERMSRMPGMLRMLQR